MNYLEITGALFGIAGIFLTIKEKVWCFPIGIINVIITAYLVIEARLYADFLQQIVYLILLILGWYKWTHKQKATNDLEQIAFMSWQSRYIQLMIWIAGSVLMFFLLKNYTDALFPFWDSLGTVLCFIAQWLVAKKKIENWLLWMLANLMYIVIYYLKDMPSYSILMAVYFLLAIQGWFDWKKKLLLKN